MGLLKWIKRELDSSNSCKRRQSEPPLSENKSQLPQDESYMKALSRFNEWRAKQKLVDTSRLSRKQSKKLLAKRGQSDTFFENRNKWNNKETLSKNVTTIDNSLYEEIQLSEFETPQTNINPHIPARTLEVLPIRHSIQTPDITSALIHRDSSVGQTNKTYENITHFDHSPDILNSSKLLLSPPIKFFKENSNPFANATTPIREEVSEDISERIYEIPRDLESLDALRAKFRPLEDISHRRSSGKSNQLPPYQIVINKHGDEVEYALPLNEKTDDGFSGEIETGKACAVVAFNSTSNYQQYIEKNFEFLNENQQLGISGLSESLSRNHFERKNVPVTDLDKTNGSKETDDQSSSKNHNIIQELESLEAWSRNIGENLEKSIVKKTANNMHFAEIIVCNTQEVAENDPREVLEALNGTYHAGTFHCVPVTQFKPHRKENICGDSILQMNYEVLRKLRHPDMSLLMGITVDNKCAMDSLILEPLDYSLNHFIHTEATCIPVPECLLYTQQITNAVTYLHKHGLIHSNISSHTIYMSKLSKAVKLTSFELTTTQSSDLRDELMDVFQNNNQCIQDISQLPYKLLPFNNSYRKAFTVHNYQAPELLSVRFPFVFPKTQSDVYGICITLWEMISCSTPYAGTTYEDLVQIIHLQNSVLPTVQPERQTPFDGILKLGLNMEPANRFSDTTQFIEVLKNISLYFEEKTEEKLISIKDRDEVPDLLSPKIFGPMIYERNSTIKKRNNVITTNHLNVRELFAYSQMNKTNGMIPSHTSSPNSPKCGFEIGEVSLPETPIARSNKLRKTAWLSNQSLSPIVHLEIKTKEVSDTSVNPIQIVEKKLPNTASVDDTFSGKSYNVNIRIRPSAKKPKRPSESSDNSNSAVDNCSLIQVNKNSSHISDHIKFFNSVSQLKTHQAIPQIGKTASPIENQVNYNKNGTKPNLKIEKKLDQHLDPGITQKNISEFYSRTQSADFENSLWRREKQKCDQSVKSPRRISVKDAVNKFESFSKSINESHSPKARRTPLSYSSSADENKMHSTTSNVDPAQEETDPRRSVSKLDVVLQNKDSQNEEIAKQILKETQNDTKNRETCDISKEQSPMLTLNFKKLDRRASDLSSYYIRRYPKSKPLTARHSIYGTDILKRLRKAKLSNEAESDDLREDSTKSPIAGKNIFEDKRKDFKIKVGKLTCLNCGHKLFVVDDVVSSNKDEDVNEPCTELLLTPLGRNSGLQVTKSIEDFYIDDDFCEDIELCANMELGTGTQHSDLIDFDIFSAEIFNPAEERAHLFG